jgi:hypothetical protein
MSMWEVKSAWDVVTSISSFILALGLIFVIYQIYLYRKESKLNQFNSLMEHLGSEDPAGREAREYVLSKFTFVAGDTLDRLENKYKYQVESVLSKYNKVCFLALKKVISQNDVVELLGKTMSLCWEKTEYFIKARRLQENEPEKGRLGCYMYSLQLFLTKNKKKIQQISST